MVVLILSEPECLWQGSGEGMGDGMKSGWEEVEGGLSGITSLEKSMIQVIDIPPVGCL